MRTSFHHQPEAQRPNFPLSTSWQADYPIFRGEADIAGLKFRSAAGVLPDHVSTEEAAAPSPVSERFRPTPRTCGRFRGILGLR